ncbi:MAG TPA: hypothetical protein VN673_15090 [Clostridia bacterium]|nr:hypothetical protein [Clostridia bacterium]
MVDCAVELHRNLGPGLLETVYEVTLARVGLTRTINGCLDSEPPCLGASVRKKFIALGASPNVAPPHR